MIISVSPDTQAYDKGTKTSRKEHRRMCVADLKEWDENRIQWEIPTALSK